MSSHVHKLHSSSREPMQHTLRIPSMFRDYCAALYDLDSKASPTEAAQKQARIEAYLSSSGFPNFPNQFGASYNFRRVVGYGALSP